MSTIKYKMGSEKYTIDSQLQLKGIELIAVEENLNEEIRLDIQKRKLPHYGPPHDIFLNDDNGLSAYTSDLTKIGNLKLKKNENI